MDPLSITTGVLSLLGVCIQTGTMLKDFYDSAAIADTKVKGLLTEIEGFTQVLQLMNGTLEQQNIQSLLRETGHISDHLNNLETSIQDGQKTLLQLQETIERVNKSVSLLDGARKHLRLRSAADEIAIYQQQIRSYKDTLQLTLQTIILWNQITFRESTDKIMPNLDDIQQAIRRIAFDINDRIAGLQNALESRASDKSSDHELHSLTNLRNCVKSAASIVSSASTIQSVDRSDRMSIAYESDFGDCFPSEPAETMRRWISSNTVYEFEEERNLASSLIGANAASGKSLELVERSRESDQSDSDGELESEIIQSLLRRGKDMLASEEFEAAERHFRNCLTRASSNEYSGSLHHLLASKSEIMSLLLVTYQHQEKWDEVHSLLMEKIALESRGSSKTNQGVLADTLILVEVLLQKCAYAEALLYGRRALKGYRKLGLEGTLSVQNSLRLLCQVCKAAGNHDEEDAYSAILSDSLEKPSPAAEPTATTISERPAYAMISHKVSAIERGPYLESPIVRNLSYQDSLRSNSSRNSGSQASSTSNSIMPTSHRRNPSLSSSGSLDPISPYTTYSPLSARSQERFPTVKNHSLPLTENVVPSRSSLSNQIVFDDTSKKSKNEMNSPPTNPILENSFKLQKVNDDCKLLPVGDVTKFVPRAAEQDKMERIQHSKDNANMTGVIIPATSPPPLTTPKVERLEQETEPLEEQNNSKPLQSKKPTTPVILLPVSVEHTTTEYSKELTALQPARARAKPPKIKPKQVPGLKFSEMIANHASTNIEVAAIEYFRAKKGNPPKPEAPKSRAPVPVSDYELLQWIGTHPDFPFDQQTEPSVTKKAGTGLEVPQKTLPKSKSASDLLNSGVFELPTGFSHRSKSTVNLHGSISTEDKKTEVAENASNKVDKRAEWDAFFATLERNNSTKLKKSTVSHENDTAPPPLLPRLKIERDFVDAITKETTPPVLPARPEAGGITINIVTAENDNPLLKTLIEMGYPRTEALPSLERYDYDIERAANYLAIQMSGEPSSPLSQTDIRSNRMGVHEPFRLYVPPLSESGNMNMPLSAGVSSFETPARPVSFHGLAQFQSSSLSPSWDLNQSNPITSSSQEPKSYPLAETKSHKKSHSFDSAFTTAESRQNKLSEIGRQLQNSRPKNPIGTFWHADSYSGGTEISTAGPSVANDLQTKLSKPFPFQNEEINTADQQILSEYELQEASPDGLSVKPAVTFSEILSNQTAVRRKIMISGDVFSGKSSLVSVFSKGVFPEAYLSTELAIETVQEQTGGKNVELTLWDISGDLNYANLRSQCYVDSHLVVICFAIDNPDSLGNAEELFYTEMKNAYNSARCILVGLKKDLRHDMPTIHKLKRTKEHLVSIEEGQAASIRIKALRYMECSAKTGEGVKELFEVVTVLAMSPNQKLKPMRSIRRLFRS